jgi:hypothetical protein
MGANNIIYLRRSAASSTGTITYTINNLINPAYKMEVTDSIFGYAIISDKVYKEYEFVITRTIIPC